MVKISLIFLYSVVLLTAQTTFALNKNNLKIGMEEIIQRHQPNSQVGIVVRDADSGEVIFQRRQQELFFPASVLKLFTATAALQHFGSEYKFKTSLRVNSQQDVALEFSGDPTLTTQSLEGLLTHINFKKIRTLIIDDQIFSGPEYAPGWFKSDANWYFSGPITSMFIDKNEVGFEAITGSKLGEKVSIQPSYNTAYMKLLKADITTVTQEDSENLCQLEVNVNEQNDLMLGGCWPIDMPTIKFRFAVQNVRKYVQGKITDTLQARGISVATIKFAKARKGMKVIAQVESPKLIDIVEQILAESNNQYADAVTKALGASLYARGSFKTGTLAVKNILAQQLEVDFTQLKMEDGSGGSRYNLLSPLQVTELLSKFYAVAEIKGYLFKTLAVAGEKGLLKARLDSSELKGKLVAKTGTATGNSGLAGYLTTKNKKNLIVVILNNNSLSKPPELKAMEDELCKFLYEY